MDPPLNTPSHSPHHYHHQSRHFHSMPQYFASAKSYQHFHTLHTFSKHRDKMLPQRPLQEWISKSPFSELFCCFIIFLLVSFFGFTPFYLSGQEYQIFDVSFSFNVNCGYKGKENLNTTNNTYWYLLFFNTKIGAETLLCAFRPSDKGIRPFTIFLQSTALHHTRTCHFLEPATKPCHLHSTLWSSPTHPMLRK